MSKVNGYLFKVSKKITIEDNTIGTYTGVTSYTRLTSVFIPANTFTTGDVITIDWQAQKNGQTAISNFALYYNTSDTLTSATQLSVRSIGATNQNIYGYRRAAIRAANGNTYISSTTTGVDTDFSVFSATPSTVSLNWTVDSYILLAGFASATENIRSIFLKVGT